MDNIWSTAIKATGSVGVVGALIYFTLSKIFSEQIIAIFGSDKLFALTILIISALLIVFLVAILKSKETQGNTSKSGDNKVTYKDKATHNGDNNF